MLAVLVEHRLVLNAPALVAGLHRAEHPASIGDALELDEHRLLEKIGELIDDIRALERILIRREPPLLVDDHLDRKGPAHRLRRRRRDRLVVGVGVEGVRVVVERAQGLEGRANVVEVHLLRVQGTTRGLDVVLHLLGALVRAVLVAHGDRPQAARHPAKHRVLGVHAVGEEEGQVRREVIDLHAAGEVRLDIREAIRESECQLADGVRAGLGDVVAADRHRVEVADGVIDEPLLDIGHAAQCELGREDAGVLPLILLEDVGLDSASHRAQRASADFVRLPRIRLAALVRTERSQLLIDRRIQEHRENRRCGAVDRHRDGRCRRAQVEAGEEIVHVVDRGDRDAGGAHLAEDVRLRGRVAAIEGDGVEGGRQAGGRLALAQQVEPPVRALGIALAREHASRRLPRALEREDT